MAARRCISSYARVDALEDRTGPAVGDRGAIDLRDRHEARGRARQEDLVGDQQVERREALDRRRDAQLAADLEDRLAGDPFKDAALRRDHDPVAHREQVVAGRLADEAVLVEQQRLVGRGIDRLDLGEHEVQVVEVLHPRIEGRDGRRAGST